MAEAAVPVVRAATTHDLDRILILNRTFEHFLSVIDAAKLDELHAAAAYHRVIDTNNGIGGFLIAFRENDDYGGENFRWFKQRFTRFLYIDRVVVAPGQHGRGIGAALYRDVIAFARASGVRQITCEYDVEPPNDASARFHAAFGFTELCQRSQPPKCVSMQLLSLERA